MLNWVAVSKKIHRDLKTQGIAFLTKLDTDQTVGKLVRVFSAMADEAKDGDLSSVQDATLEEWAAWTGKRGTFAKAFRESMCDENGVVTAWEEYNGRAIRKADHDAAVKREWRKNGARRGAGQSEGQGDAGASDRHTRAALNIDTDNNKQQIANSPELFEECFGEYPKRPDERRHQAYKAWSDAIEDGESPAEILEGVKRYANACRVEKKESRFVLSFKNFVNERKYRDAWTPAEAKPNDQPFSVPVYT